MRIFWYSVACISLLVLTFVLVVTFESEHTFEAITKEVEEVFKPTTILFVGDIMLGRGVETLMRREGEDYPFLGVATYTKSATRTVGNFEAAMPENHTQTPSMVLKLSAQSDVLTPIREHGFDILSFANNHTYDFGATGFIHSQKVCEKAALTCVGSTYSARDGTHIEKIDGKNIAFIMLNDAGLVLNTEHAIAEVAAASASSTMQIVYIHWGDEYEKIHNARQEKLARAFIDAGADAIIGMHPHVVQDIELYKGKPIFYSLGNFIFDQWFSDDVQEGLMVELTLHKHRQEYTLIPVTTIGSPSQPRAMSSDEASAYLTDVFARNTTTQNLKGHTISIVATGE